MKMPTKNDGETDAEGDVSGAESDRSNTSHGHESSDEEANEMDSDDSSEMDVTDLEKRRVECDEYLGKKYSMSVLSILERQFNHLREQYYFERVCQIDRQLIDVRSERSDDYQMPLKDLDKNYKNRCEVAEMLRKYCLTNIQHKYISEMQAANQHFESERDLCFDMIHDEIKEKMRRLEEDRHNVDISWSDWSTDKRTNKVRGPGRKKPVTVSGPYIIYMLRDEEILEDWNAIRKTIKRTTVPTA